MGSYGQKLRRQRIEHQTKLDLARDDDLGDTGIVQNGHLRGDRGVAQLQLSDERWHETLGERVDEGKAHMSPTQAAKILERDANRVELFAPAPGLIEQQRPRGRESQSARQSLEQRQPQLLLCQQDLPIDGGCGDIEYF